MQYLPMPTVPLGDADTTTTTIDPGTISTTDYHLGGLLRARARVQRWVEMLFCLPVSTDAILWVMGTPPFCFWRLITTVGHSTGTNFLVHFVPVWRGYHRFSDLGHFIFPFTILLFLMEAILPSTIVLIPLLFCSGVYS